MISNLQSSESVAWKAGVSREYGTLPSLKGRPLAFTVHCIIYICLATPCQTPQISHIRPRHVTERRIHLLVSPSLAGQIAFFLVTLKRKKKTGLAWPARLYMRLLQIAITAWPNFSLTFHASRDRN